MPFRVLLVAVGALAWFACGGSDTVEDVVADVEVTDEGNPEVDVPIETNDPGTDAEGIGESDADAEAEIADADAEIEIPDADAEAECQKDCTGKVCGPDGCGGLCGTCEEPTPVCKDDQSECIAKACTYPAAWGKVGVVATMETPGTADADFIKNSCPDFSGDGNGDNGLKSLATTVNPELKKALDGGDIGIIFEFRGVTDFANTASFVLAGLIGEPDATDATKYLVDPMSYDPTTASGECAPMIAFDAAKIASGALSAGPSLFALSIPLQGMLLEFTLEDAQIEATIADDAVTATGGVIAGVFTKAQADVLIAKLEAQCAVEPSDICGYLGTIKAFLPMLFDLDQDKDGKKDAASICMKFTLKGGTVAGLKQ
jgi:hypothetical protein